MSKTLRTAGMIVAAVAIVAATAGAAAPLLAPSMAGTAGIAGVSAATLTAIGTYGSLAAGVLSAIAVATAPGVSAQGSATSFTTNPQSGLPYAMGRTRMSGLRFFADTTDGFPGKTTNDLLCFGGMLSIGGQIESIESFTADGEAVTFDANGNANGRFRNYMAQKVWTGGVMASALALSLGTGAFPGWTSQHKLSGITHALWMLRFNKEGELYGAGAPEPAWIGKWVKVYDPRLDSTYPGGSGPCRALNEATYVWSQNPGLHALTWALGRWENGKRTCGIGAPVTNIRVAEFVECANVCEANAWKVGGVEWTTDSKWDTLKRIMQAGGARPTQTGAMIGCLVSAPRTAIATIEGRHLLDGLSIAATKSRRDRFNTVIPRYVDEDSDWAVISGTAITVPDYVTADKGQRTKEIDYPLVQVFAGETASQPGQLAAYDIVNSREAGPITWTTGPEWIGLKTGDVVYLNVPEEGLVNQPVLITRRAPDPSTGKVSFAAETETYSKHAYALGQSTTPPAPFSLSAPDLKPAAPDAIIWAVSGTTSGEGFPALIVTGTSELPSADAIVIDYQLAGAGDWKNSAIVSAIEPVSHVIAPLQSQTAYDVRIGYRVGTIVGNFTIFAGITTGLGKVTIIEQQIVDQDALIAQLETDTAQAMVDIAAAEALITEIQGSVTVDIAALTAEVGTITANVSDLTAKVTAAGGAIDAIETTLGTQGASITTLQTTVSNNTGTLATHTSQISTANANISTNATAISTANTNIANLTVRVSSAESSITTSATAITNLTGRTATLETTVSAQGASITTLQTTTSTLTGSLATLTTRVQAGVNNNLVPNGGFETSGLTGWVSSGASFSVGASGGWGLVAGTYGDVANGTAIFLDSARFGVFATFNYTASADSVLLILDGTGSTTVEILFFNSSGAIVGNPQSASRANEHNFTTDGSSRIILTASGAAPATATQACIRLTGRKFSGTLTALGWRRAKVEQGSIATPFSSEVSVAMAFTAISTLDTQYASLSTVVGTQGANISLNATAITTLQGTSASLQTQINSTNASVSTNATAITTLQGNVATLTTRVSASGANLLLNGGLENGFASGVANAGGFVFAVSAEWGAQASTSVEGYRQLDFDGFLNPQIGAQYTFSVDPLVLGSSNITCDIVCVDAGGSIIASSPYSLISGGNYSNDAARRAQIASTVLVPAGTALLVCRVFGTVVGGMSIGFRRAKLEQGAQWSHYSAEASIVQQFSTLSTLTTQYASLSTTVSTQGVTITSQQTAITTLNGLFAKAGIRLGVGGYWTGWELNNNGSSGDMLIDVDFLRVGKQGNGASYPFQVIGGTTYIQNAMIQDAAITTAKIGDLQVNTLKIAGNAVTVPVTAFTAGTMGFASDVWTTIQELVIGGSGGPIQIAASFHIYTNRSSATPNHEYQLLRNGTALFGPSILPVYAIGADRLYRGPISFTIQDTPGAGTHTYTLQCKRDAGTFDASYRSLTATEFKR